MDQEKFDQHLMDYLFDELDEVTRAAMKRKIESDVDCRELEAGLRATLEVAQLPIEEPDDELEARILEAANQAQASEPLMPKLWRALSWAGSHAMRPQLAMAAILLLVVGSALVLLPAKPGSVAVTPVKDGDTVPQPIAPAPAEPAEDSPAVAEQEAEPAPAPNAEPSPATPTLASADLDARYKQGVANFQAGNYAQAQADFALVNQSPGPNAPLAALYEARAVRAQSGCSAAIAYYDKVRSRFGGAPVSADAAWEQADCHRQLGQNEQARGLWLALIDNDAYHARASSQLASEGQAVSTGGTGIAQQKRAAAPAPVAAAPPPAAPPPAKAEPPEGTTGKGAKASPNEYDAMEDAASF